VNAHITYSEYAVGNQLWESFFYAARLQDVNVHIPQSGDQVLARCVNDRYVLQKDVRLLIVLRRADRRQTYQSHYPDDRQNDFHRPLCAVIRYNRSYGLLGNSFDVSRRSNFIHPGLKSVGTKATRSDLPYAME
jgi:hypothetical protein